MPAVIPFPSSASSSPSWFSLSASADGKSASLDIRGVIGMTELWNEYGVEAAGTFTEFERAVKALGTDVREIEMNVYSPGGDVFTALAMHDLLVRHPAKVKGRVDGFAASAATVLLMAADEIEIPENAYFMIHNPLIGVYGDYREIEVTLGRMKKWTRDIANLYTARLEDSGKGDRAEILENILGMMDAETYLTGIEAKNLGFADRVTGRMDLAACATRSPLRPLSMCVHHPDRVPAEIRALIDSPATATASGAHEAPGVSTENQTTTAMPENLSNDSVPASQPAPEPQPAATIAPAAANAGEVSVETGAPEASTTVTVDEPTATVEAPAPAAQETPDLVAQLGALLDQRLAPLNEQLTAQRAEIDRLSALRAHGVDPQAWGNAPATGDSLREESAEQPVAFETLTPEAKIGLGVAAYQKRLKDAKNQA